MKKITFDYAMEEYLKYVKIKDKPQSYRSIKGRMKVLSTHFKNCYVNDIGTYDYFLFQIEIEKRGYSYKYNKAIHYTMVTFLNYCIKFHGLKKNVAKDVGNFKNNEVSKRKIRVLSNREFRKFKRKEKNIIYKFAFDFLYFTGARLGEVNALTFDDKKKSYINITKTISKEFYNGERIITTPKTKNSIRMIRIDLKLRIELFILKYYYKFKYKRFDNSFYLFGGEKPFAPTTLERHKNKCCELANIEKFRIHDLRHSHASILINEGVPVPLVTSRLGHSDIAMTLNTYTHAFKEHEKRVTRTLLRLRLHF